MLGATAVEWENLTVAAAFVLGAACATVATLRVVRHVATIFARKPPDRGNPSP